MLSEQNDLNSYPVNLQYYMVPWSQNIISVKYSNYFDPKSTIYFPLLPFLPGKNDEISLVIEAQAPIATVLFLWFISACSATNTTDVQTRNQPNN
jgi:hypothetical protein